MTQHEQTVHDSIMDALSNLVAHYHMADGWTDSLFPYKKVIHEFDPKLMPQLIKARGEAKVLIKMLSKLIRDDEDTIDHIYEQLGKTVSLMAMMGPEQRARFGEKLNNLLVELDNEEMTI